MALALIVALGSSARAAVPTCRDLEAAPLVGAGDAAAVWSASVTAAMNDASARLDGAERAPRVTTVDLGPTTGAWYCQGSDTVFVAHALVAYAYLGRASDGADFLAFVIGHELAHRRFDAPLGPGGAALRGDALPLAREAAADQRAAFLVALARDPFSGRRLSPWKLARNATLAHYLSDEVGLDPASPAGRARIDALQRSLHRMADLAEVYELAVALAFAPLAGPNAPRDLAPGLLAELDAALNADESWARVPELSLLRAVLHAERAAATLGLRCAVRFPGRAALSPFDALGARGAAGPRLATELVAARRALRDAHRRHLPRQFIAPVEACLAVLARASEHGSPHPTAAAPRRGSDVVVELAALAAEEACAGDARDARRIALGGDLALQVRGGPAARCFAFDPERALRVVELAPPDPDAADLATWLAACDVVGQGVGDDGGDVFGVHCPTVDGSRLRAWTLFARDARLTRIVRITSD